MAMSYTSLTASKSTTGSLANWVNYSRLDIPVILDEAQALIYQFLRVREMQSSFAFTMAVGASQAAAPTGFLDPIGRMVATTTNDDFEHLTQSQVLNRRSYSAVSGSLGNNPFTTTANSTEVAVALTAHGFTQGSTISFNGATAVGGLNLNASATTGWVINSIIDANQFTVNGSALDAASSSTTGGGAAVTYACDKLQQGVPAAWSIWDEKIQFDEAFSAQTICRLGFYRSLPLLSATNETNFLTSRYPNLLRSACQTAAADYMKDDQEYAKGVARLQILIGRIQQGDDLQYRGADIYTETP
jgi:hypothetical protein